MVRQFFANFTWLDLCSAVIVVRGCWIGFQKGFLIEVFKLIGLIAAVFVGFHFYIPFGDFLNDVLRVPKPVAHIFSYGLLIGVTVGLFQIMRGGLIVLLRDQDQEEAAWQRLVGLIFGLCRGVIFSSLVIVGCLVSGQSVLTRTVRHSFSAPALAPVSPAIYSGIFRAAVRPIFSNETENTRISTLVSMNQRVYE